jgi:hypothetical protein
MNRATPINIRSTSLICTNKRSNKAEPLLTRQVPRLHARDGNILEIVRRGEALNFGQLEDFFLENYSKPPIRELKTH